MNRAYDVIIRQGLLMDGTGAAARQVDLGIREGRVAALSEVPLDETGCAQVIDARGRWVTPGFIDIHTHYDAELIVAPALSESVRHGVTTVLVGSCSLSMICSPAEDASDIFTRVETVPREKVLPILRQHKHWNTPAQWLDFVARQPLGPNLVSFIGHSDLRAAVMGLERATRADVVPEEAELQRMEALLEEALRLGFLGMSTMSLKWDKVDGDRAWSRSLPSSYARWSEIRRLNRLLRRYGRIHQGAPNAATPLQILEFFWETVGLFLRAPLKTTLISLIDLKGNKTVLPMARFAGRMANALGGNFRWQLLPTPFTVYAEGIDVVFFEEFKAGEMALDLREQCERNSLMQDEKYRRMFRKFYGRKLSPRVWQRDFGDATILECPDRSMVGRNFAELARARGLHVVDFFLDTVVAFGRSLRWCTTVGNHRPQVLGELARLEQAMIGFSDAGAHIRNMAFYNTPLRFLKLVQQSHQQGRPLMSLEQAVRRLSGEIGEWLGVAAGTLRLGDRADVLVINPERLQQDLEAVSWAEMENFGLQRLVNRNPGIVEQVLIRGQPAVRDEVISPQLGREAGFGQFLPVER